MAGFHILTGLGNRMVKRTGAKLPSFLGQPVVEIDTHQGKVRRVFVFIF